MFEVLYRLPENREKETALTEQVMEHGGRLDFREVSEHPGQNAICLTYEFADLTSAQEMADRFRQPGEHVDGPYDYGA